MVDANLSFDVGSGVLIAVPIPVEAGDLGDEVEQAIQQALNDARYGIHVTAVLGSCDCHVTSVLGSCDHHVTAVLGSCDCHVIILCAICSFVSSDVQVSLVKESLHLCFRESTN